MASLILVITALSPSQAGDIRDLRTPHNQHSQIDLIGVAPGPHEPKAQRLNGYAHDYRQEAEQGLEQHLEHELDQNRAMETEDLRRLDKLVRKLKKVLRERLKFLE